MAPRPQRRHGPPLSAVDPVLTLVRAGLAGQPEQAREVLGRLEELSRHRYVSPYHFAYVFVGLGEFDRALDQLEQAYEERGGAIWGIKGSFLFQPLRSHPRFTALLQKMNLA